jgi:hypothetical protein
VIAETAVRTVGINWASVITIICSIVGALAIIFGFIAKYISRTLTQAITDSINVFRISVVQELANRLTIVETKVDVLINTRGRDKAND